MVTASDIGNEEKLKAWLLTNSFGQADSAIARAGLRVFPFWALASIGFDAQTDRQSALSVFRVFLVASFRTSERWAYSEEKLAKVVKTGRDSADRIAHGLKIESIVNGQADGRVVISNSTVAFSRAFDALEVMCGSVAKGWLAWVKTDPGRLLDDSSEAIGFATAAISSPSGSAAVAGATAKSLDENKLLILNEAASDSLVSNLEPFPVRKLWSGTNPLQGFWNYTCSEWAKPGSPYDFWLRWYDSLLDPAQHKPFPVELLHEIAILPEDLWQGEGAPEVIAAEIARLEDKHRLEAEIKEARAAVKAAQEEIKSLKAGVAPPAQRSGNYPADMEPLEVEYFERELEDAGEALREAETEIKKTNPAARVLLVAAKALGKAALSIAKYCGAKADKVVDTALEEGTKQIVKWGVRVGGVALADQILGVSEMIEHFGKTYPFP